MILIISLILILLAGLFICHVDGCYGVCARFFLVTAQCLLMRDLVCYTTDG